MQQPGARAARRGGAQARERTRGAARAARGTCGALSRCMTRFFERLGNVLAAVAFAEEGDAETAIRLAAEGAPDRDAPSRPTAAPPPAKPRRGVPVPRRQGA